MAVLTNPPDHNIISSLRGVIDIYCCRGLWVARSWPRKPRHPRTHSQTTHWSHFRAMIRYRSSMPPDWRAHWRAVLPPPHARTEDNIRHELSFFSEVGLPDFHPTTARVSAVRPSHIKEPQILWPDSRFDASHASRFALRYLRLPSLPGHVPYTLREMQASRQRAYVSRYRIDTNAFETSSITRLINSPQGLAFRLPTNAPHYLVYLTDTSGPAAGHLLSPPIALTEREVF